MSEDVSSVDDALNEFHSETLVKLNREDAGVITAILSEYAMGLADQGRALLHINDVRGAKACADQLMHLHAIVTGIKDGEFISDTFDDKVLRERMIQKRESNLHIKETAERVSRGIRADDEDDDGPKEPQRKTRLH